MVTELIARRVSPPRANHGEGVVADPESGTVRHVDMFAGSIVEVLPNGGQTQVVSHDMVAAFRPCTGGGIVGAGRDRFFLRDADGHTRWLPRLWPEREELRFNEGATDREGRFHCGTLAGSQGRAYAGLYRLNLNLTAERVVEDVVISNGLVFSLDGRFSVLVDSAAGQLRRYPIDRDGIWGTPSVFIEPDPADGTPDGICMDEDGGLWVAMWGGGCVLRYSAQGELTHRVVVPVSQPTSCGLGGHDGRVLFITSSRFGLQAGSEPLAGAVFAADAPYRGVPDAPARYGDRVRGAGLTAGLDTDS